MLCQVQRNLPPAMPQVYAATSVAIYMLCRQICRQIYPVCRHIHLDLPQSLYIYAAIYIYYADIYMLICRNLYTFMSTYILDMPQDLPQCLFMYAAITVINLSQDLPQVSNSSCRKLPQTACGRLKSISVGVHNSSSQDLPQTTSNQHMD